MDKKRIVFLIIFGVVTIILGYLLYRVFFAPRPRVAPPEEAAPAAPAALPTAAEAEAARRAAEAARALPRALPSARVAPAVPEAAPRVTQAVESAITNPRVDPSGRVQFYNDRDGKFYKMNADGTTELLSDQTFFRVDNVTWSPTKNEAVLEYPDGANISYNFDTKEQVTLPKHWEDFSFSPLGDKIASKSIALAEENRWLLTANADGSQITLIEPLGRNADKVTVDWSPNKQVVALSRTGNPLGAFREEVLFVGLAGENFRSITVEGRGFQSQWSPSGERLMYSVYSDRTDYKPELWIVNAQGDDIGTGRRQLAVNTWAEKCAFSDERFVYCAVPNTLQRGAGFAPEVADSTPDTIYRIDTQTGLRTAVETDEPHVVDSMFLSADGRTIYFTDKRQDGLFQVAL